MSNVPLTFYFFTNTRENGQPPQTCNGWNFKHHLLRGYRDLDGKRERRQDHLPARQARTQARGVPETPQKITCGRIVIKMPGTRDASASARTWSNHVETLIAKLRNVVRDGGVSAPRLDAISDVLAQLAEETHSLRAELLLREAIKTGVGFPGWGFRGEGVPDVAPENFPTHEEGQRTPSSF